LRAVPEVMTLLKGIAAAMRSVGTTLIVLGLIIYFAGVVFVNLLRDDAAAKGRFESVPMSVNFLMLQVICGIEPQVVMDLLHAGWFYYLTFLLFVFIASLTIMNMLVGGVVGVVSQVGEAERDKARARQQKEEISFVINAVVDKIEYDHNGDEERQELEQALLDPDLLTKLVKMEIDLVSFVDFTRFILPDHGELSLETFREILSSACMLFMGQSKASTVKDVLDARQVLSMELGHLEERMMRKFGVIVRSQFRAIMKEKEGLSRDVIDI
jgi:hypothetical protein